MMLGAAVALTAPEVSESLAGNVVLIAVPAEEFIDVEYRWELHNAGKLGLMAGKQEFIRLGAFDDVDMAMMVHTSGSSEDGKFAVGGTSNGHLVKFVNFLGKAAHAGGAPHQGINALQASMVALNALNAQRETLRNEDAVRLHGILTRGGAAANAVPADVRYEGRVRGRTPEAVADANIKMDRCLRAGALAMGAKVKIVTIPATCDDQQPPADGALHGQCGPSGGGVQRQEPPGDQQQGRLDRHGGPEPCNARDPPVHGGGDGLGPRHRLPRPDYDQGVIKPAQTMAMTVIDLLSGDAERANEVTAQESAQDDQRTSTSVCRTAG